METPMLVVLGIAALLVIMYFFGGSTNMHGGSCTSCKRVRFNDQPSCSSDTCGL